MTFIVAQEEPQTEVVRYTAGKIEAPNPMTHRQNDSWLGLAPLAVLGGISAIAYYLGFVRPYLLEEYYSRPLMDLAKINGHTAQSANAWALTWIILFSCYYLAFRLCPPSDNVSRGFRWVALAIICGWAAFFAANLLFMYPVGAADLFDQIFRARLLAKYNLNPFTTLPNNIEGDPFQAYVAWRGDPSPYGPMWESLAAGTSWLAGDNLWGNLVLFKLLVTAAYGVNVALTYGILRAVKPDWALRGTIFFAWNPLVLFEVAGNGHNDSIVVTFLLAGVYLFVLARRSLVLAALMAGALTKFVPALLIPAAAAAIWRDRTRLGRGAIASENEAHLPVRRKPLGAFDAFSTLAIGGVIALGLAVVMYAPFWAGPESVGALGRKGLFTASIPKVILDTLVKAGVAEGMAQDVVRSTAFWLTVAVAMALALWVFVKGNARDARERHGLVSRTLIAFYEIIFFYLAFATLWFQPWYLMWLVALTAPVARYTYANRTILFCIGGVANYFVWDYIWLWNGADFRTIQISAAIAVYSLPIFYSLLVLLGGPNRRTMDDGR